MLYMTLGSPYLPTVYGSPGHFIMQGGPELGLQDPRCSGIRELLVLRCLREYSFPPKIDSIAKNLDCV